MPRKAAAKPSVSEEEVLPSIGHNSGADADEFEAVNEQIAEEIPQDMIIKTMNAAVDRGIKLIEMIDELDKQTKVFKEELLEITQKKLPDAMTAAKQTSFTTDKGYKISIKDFISGALPKEAKARAKAMEWLECNDGGPILKATVIFELPKGYQDNKPLVKLLDKIRTALMAAKITPIEKVDAHPQTLYHFVRERLKKGKVVPLEDLNLYSGRHAKIEPPKGKDKEEPVGEEE